MCCSPIHCIIAFHCEDVSCPEGFSARSPGSWQGGTWVSALLCGLFYWTSSQDLAMRSGGVLLFLCKISDSLAHKLLAPLELSWSGRFSLGFVGVGFVVLLCFCVSFVVWPDKTSDCVKVRTPLSTPQGGT